MTRCVRGLCLGLTTVLVGWPASNIDARGSPLHYQLPPPPPQYGACKQQAAAKRVQWWDWQLFMTRCIRAKPQERRAVVESAVVPRPPTQDRP
jgi:hypothetical protein